MRVSSLPNDSGYRPDAQEFDVSLNGRPITSVAWKRGTPWAIVGVQMADEGRGEVYCLVSHAAGSIVSTVPADQSADHVDQTPRPPFRASPRLFLLEGVVTISKRPRQLEGAV